MLLDFFTDGIRLEDFEHRIMLDVLFTGCQWQTLFARTDMFVPVRAGVEIYKSMSVPQRAGVEIYRGMSVPLRTGVGKYDDLITYNTSFEQDVYLGQCIIVWSQQTARLLNL